MFYFYLRIGGRLGPLGSPCVHHCWLHISMNSIGLGPYTNTRWLRPWLSATIVTLDEPIAAK